MSGWFAVSDSTLAPAVELQAEKLRKLYLQCLEWHNSAETREKALQGYEELLKNEVLKSAAPPAPGAPLESSPLLYLRFLALKNAASILVTGSPEQRHTAEWYYFSATAVNPSATNVWFPLGDLASQLGHLELARVSFAACVRNNAHHLPAHRRLIQVLHAQFDYPGCFRAATEAARLWPNDEYVTHFLEVCGPNPSMRSNPRLELQRLAIDRADLAKPKASLENVDLTGTAVEILKTAKDIFCNNFQSSIKPVVITLRGSTTESPDALAMSQIPKKSRGEDELTELLKKNFAVISNFPLNVSLTLNCAALAYPSVVEPHCGTEKVLTWLEKTFKLARTLKVTADGAPLSLDTIAFPQGGSNLAAYCTSVVQWLSGNYYRKWQDGLPQVFCDLCSALETAGLGLPREVLLCRAEIQLDRLLLRMQRGVPVDSLSVELKEVRNLLSRFTALSLREVQDKFSRDTCSNNAVTRHSFVCALLALTELQVGFGSASPACNLKALELEARHWVIATRVSVTGTIWLPNCATFSFFNATVIDNLGKITLQIAKLVNSTPPTPSRQKHVLSSFASLLEERLPLQFALSEVPSITHTDQPTSASCVLLHGFCRAVLVQQIELHCQRAATASGAEASEVCHRLSELLELMCGDSGCAGCYDPGALKLHEAIFLLLQQNHVALPPRTLLQARKSYVLLVRTLEASSERDGAAAKLAGLLWKNIFQCTLHLFRGISQEAMHQSAAAPLRVTEWCTQLLGLAKLTIERMQPFSSNPPYGDLVAFCCDKVEWIWAEVIPDLASLDSRADGRAAESLRASVTLLKVNTEEFLRKYLAALHNLPISDGPSVALAHGEKAIEISVRRAQVLFELYLKKLPEPLEHRLKVEQALFSAAMHSLPAEMEDVTSRWVELYDKDRYCSLWEPVQIPKLEKTSTGVSPVFFALFADNLLKKATKKSRELAEQFFGLAQAHQALETWLLLGVKSERFSVGWTLAGLLDINDRLLRLIEETAPKSVAAAVMQNDFDTLYRCHDLPGATPQCWVEILRLTTRRCLNTGQLIADICPQEYYPHLRTSFSMLDFRLPLVYRLHRPLGNGQPPLLGGPAHIQMCLELSEKAGNVAVAHLVRAKCIKRTSPGDTDRYLSALVAAWTAAHEVHDVSSCIVLYHVASAKCKLLVRHETSLRIHLPQEGNLIGSNALEGLDGAFLECFQTLYYVFNRMALCPRLANPQHLQFLAVYRFAWLAFTVLPKDKAGPVCLDLLEQFLVNPPKTGLARSYSGTGYTQLLRSTYDPIKNLNDDHQFPGGLPWQSRWYSKIFVLYINVLCALALSEHSSPLDPESMLERAVIACCTLRTKEWTISEQAVTGAYAELFRTIRARIEPVAEINPQLPIIWEVSCAVFANRVTKKARWLGGHGSST
eukprot:TRINITY_DN4459_c1_g1_i2.p1 TRINITY_DN4459_c1_g1~~TRINITY_DN4459_c1_g1_i2.p1  ORF type:complete len:1404 (+),score=164.75 TRINITY_DN4459_c1_g1_i2:36-4247(+)